MVYDSYIMRRTQIYLDSDQAEQLGRRARASGVTKSTVIREAIAAYLSTPDETDELARFRAAVDAAGERPIDLADGKRYVGTLREADLDRDAELEARRAGHKRSTTR
jgi:predicted transcriptional regulator